MPASKPKAVVIGWDGVTFDLLQPWVDQGLLPNMAALQRAGSSGWLELVVPPVSGPAWSSYLTGLRPAARLFGLARATAPGRTRPEQPGDRARAESVGPVAPQRRDRGHRERAVHLSHAGRR